MTSADDIRRRRELRQLILSKSGPRFRKLAMVMMQIEERAQNAECQTERRYSDDEITKEITILIETGQLEVLGDLTPPRNSEIRLRQA